MSLRALAFGLSVSFCLALNVCGVSAEDSSSEDALPVHEPADAAPTAALPSPKVPPSMMPPSATPGMPAGVTAPPSGSQSGSDDALPTHEAADDSAATPAPSPATDAPAADAPVSASPTSAVAGKKPSPAIAPKKTAAPIAMKTPAATPEAPAGLEAFAGKWLVKGARDGANTIELHVRGEKLVGNVGGRNDIELTSRKGDRMKGYLLGSRQKSQIPVTAELSRDSRHLVLQLAPPKGKVVTVTAQRMGE